MSVDWDQRCRFETTRGQMDFFNVILFRGVPIPFFLADTDTDTQYFTDTDTDTPILEIGRYLTDTDTPILLIL